MGNRSTKLISIVAATTLLSTSAVADTYYRKDTLSLNSTTVNALSLNLRNGVDTRYSSIESTLIELRCDISCDYDGYTYVDFIADAPITLEDIEIPVSFFDSIANASSEPCEIETAAGYRMQKYTSGEVLDDEGNPVECYQFVRQDIGKCTMVDKIIALKFAYAPMSVCNDSQHIPVMRYYRLDAKDSVGDRGAYYEISDEYEMYADMPEINISYLKEQERQINELNHKIEELQSLIDYMKEYPNPDFNRDGKVSIADAVYLARYICEAI